jgi:hypothetical protein
MSAEEASVDLDKIVAGMECFNSEIGNMFKIPLTRTETRRVEKNVLVDEEYERTIPIMDDNNKFTGQFTKEMATQRVPKLMEVDEEYQVPDLSILNGKDVFAFGYSEVKKKLATIFGEENIIDC